jgi:hypothetical protein
MSWEPYTPIRFWFWLDLTGLEHHLLLLLSALFCDFFLCDTRSTPAIMVTDTSIDSLGKGYYEYHGTELAIIRDLEHTSHMVLYGVFLDYFFRRAAAQYPRSSRRYRFLTKSPRRYALIGTCVLLLFVLLSYIEIPTSTLTPVIA